jgi:hypothetical protein
MSSQYTCLEAQYTVSFRNSTNFVRMLVCLNLIIQARIVVLKPLIKNNKNVDISAHDAFL